MNHRLYGASALALGALVAACSAASSLSSAEEGTTSGESLTPSCVAPINTARSLFVAPLDDEGNANPYGAQALTAFSFRAVMDRIVATGAQGSGQTSEKLYEQLVAGFNPTCPASVNGFPVECPRPESALLGAACVQAGTCEDLLQPLALVNRWDLAPADGANCGQYRIVFQVPLDVMPLPLDDFDINFEAVLPNPTPAKGIQGCLPVAQFWAGLSAASLTRADYAARLQAFYFTGLPGFSPVIDAFNYGIGAPRNSNTGQLRTNSNGGAVLGGPGQWQLRELRLARSCAGGACTLAANETFVQDNPFGALFAADAGPYEDLAKTFQKEILSKVASLSATDPNLVSMTTPNVDNAGQSSAQDTTNDYAAQAGARDSGTENTALVQAIDGKLTQLGITDLTAANVLDRATSQSCAGCHRIAVGRNMGGPDGGFVWPASTGFLQVGHDGTQSPALTSTFLPFRKHVLTRFLESQCGGEGDASSADPTRTIGGGLVGASN